MILENTLPFYIIHYTPLKERKLFLEQQLDREDIAISEWVTEQSLVDCDLTQLYDSSERALAKRLASPFSQFGYRHHCELKRNLIEVTAQHFLAYKKILEANHSYAVILEDDVILQQAFKRRLFSCIRQLPTSFDVLYFGDGCGGHHQKLTNLQKVQSLLGMRTIFKRENCQSRYADSYLVSNAFVKKIFSSFDSFHFPIDWELNYLQSALSMNIWWAEPTLSIQGSFYGNFKSGLA